MRFETFARHFPVPKFLQPNYLGLSFSDSNVKAISIQGSQPKPEVKSIIVPLEPGVLSSGKVINAEELVSKLSVIKEYFDLPYVAFTIPDELVYIFEAKVPYAPGSNGTEAVAFTIEENVPLSLSDTIFDFLPIKVLPGSNELQIETVVVASVKKDVEKLSEVIVESGLMPLGAIHESQAVANALIPKGEVGSHYIIHARKERIGIYLVRDSVVRFVTLRTILANDYRGQFLDEYQKFLEYVERSGVIERVSPESVLVCGDFEYAKKVVEIILANDEGLKNVKLSNVWTNILKIEDTTPSVSYEDSLNFAGTIGAQLNEIL